MEEIIFLIFKKFTKTLLLIKLKIFSFKLPQKNIKYIFLIYSI